MENKKNLVFLGITALAVLSAASYVYLSVPAKFIGPSANPDTGQNSTPTPDSTSSPQVTPRPTLSSTEEPFSGLHGIKAPATCQVDGEINFLAKDIFSSKYSKISWQNVDSQGRLINWRVSPPDNLKIGPNIFANLTIPDGQYENLTVRLPENPISKSYLLTASITYGQFIQGDLKVKEVDCFGQVRVNLNF